jgi:hypothetical protein
VNHPIFYLVRDFVEYYHSEDGALFPIKIIGSVTQNIDLLTNLEPTGKVAVLDISLNKEVEIPPIEFPPGVVVAVQEGEEHISYLWGKNNKPLKKLTSDDYELIKKEYEKNSNRTKNPHVFSYTRIILFIAGIIMILLAIFLKRKNIKK